MAELRDRVREAARIEEIAEEAGFRRRGRVWHCGFHEDRTPSASIREGRIRCFACDKSWDAIDLVRETQHLSFIDALELLAARYGIPVGRRTRAERRAAAERVAAVQQQARRLAECKADLLARYRARREHLREIRARLRRKAEAHPEGVGGLSEVVLDLWDYVEAELDYLEGPREVDELGKVSYREGAIARLGRMDYRRFLGGEAA